MAPHSASVPAAVSATSAPPPPRDSARSDADAMQRKLLHIADESPRLVGLHDKAGWLDLFSEAVVEDPVGPAKHKGRAALSRFWDALIAPFRISFHVLSDVVDERNRRVVRVVDIHVAFPELGGRRAMVQPAHLLYELDPDRGKVRLMQAHWEVHRVRPASRTLLGALGDLLLYSLAMRHTLVYLGLGFLARFAYWLVASQLTGGKALARRLIALAAADRAADFADAFKVGSSSSSSSSSSEVVLTSASTSPCSARAFVESWKGTSAVDVRAVFSAGDQVTVWYARTVASEGPARVVEGAWVLQIQPGGWFSAARARHLYVAEKGE